MTAIIFDFDGTIADSFELVLDLFYQLTNHPKFTSDQIIEFKKMTFRKAVRKVRISPRQIPFLLIKGRKSMASRLNEIKPFPGIQNALKSLHNDGYQLMVMSSNSHQNVETFLREHDLYKYIDTVYGGIGLLSKASALRKILRQNKLHSSDCFYVGDEVRDVLAAKHARVRSIAVTWGYNDVSILKSQNPFSVIYKPSELINLSLK